MKQSTLLFALVLTVGMAICRGDDRQAKIQDLNELLAKQMTGLPQYETLRQSYHHPNTLPPTTHHYIMRLGQGIEVVTESRDEDGRILQKDYFLNDSKVYALRTSEQVPSLDGKNKRVAENYFLFDGSKPIYHTHVQRRMPVSIRVPNLNDAKEQPSDLPVGADNWGEVLTARAFAIARTFRSGVGRHVFANWDDWLLKKAPPEGTGEQEIRKPDWLPRPDTTVLPIDKSESPEGLFQIGWGYEKGPIDWKKLAFQEPSDRVKAVTFSTKLAEGTLPPELEKDGCFLINRCTGKPLAKLGVYYPGERQRFNHDELIARWSPTSRCFVVIATQKWSTDGAHIAWIQNGSIDRTFDILKPLEDAAANAIMKSKHPTAKRLRTDRDSYMFSLIDIVIEDDGSFEASTDLQIPKDNEPGGYVRSLLRGTFKPAPDGESAILEKVKCEITKP